MRYGRYILACWPALACGLGCSLAPKPALHAPPAAAPAAAPPPATTPPTGPNPAANANAAPGQAAAQQAVAAALAANMSAAARPPAGPVTAETQNAAGPPATGAPAASPAPRPSTTDSQALLDTLNELQAIGAIDPETQRLVMEDLKQIDPALWPQLLQYYRTSVALRKKSELAAKPAPPSATPSVEIEMPDQSVASSGDSRPQLATPTSADSAAAAAAGESEATTNDSAAPELVAQATPRKAAPPSAARPGKGATPEKSSKVIKLVAATEPIDDPPAAAAAKTGPEADAISWEDHLRAATTELEKMTDDPAQSAAEASRHAALRLLYLVCGRREDALTPIRGIAPGQQDFWSQELYGLANYLDTERNPDSSRRAAEAVDRLREAAARLGEQATLAVKNLTFCTEVTSYGVYKAFGKDEFKAGQEVLLYAEVENFKSRQTDKGYQTALKSSYQILDPHGARVESQDFEVTEEHCHNLRRDFFMRYHIWMPKRIYGGRYTLQLTIEDTLSQKLGQSSLEFTIKE